MRWLATIAAAVLVTACSSFGEREADRYFILEAATSASAAPRSGSVSDVAPTSVSGFYDTQDIVYSRAGGTRAYYQFSHWTERPQRVIHAQLVSRLEDGAAGGLVLRTHLEEIYHDAAQPPGAARIAISAQLVDPASRSVVARRTFVRAAAATSYDAPGAVQGFDQALGALLDDIVVWVGAQAPGKAGEAPASNASGR